ncbi:MAG TPA: phospholipase D-like domain-containing protein [Steroidobacteraceae bacterium]
MRVFTSQGPLRVKAVAGTHVVLMAFDLDAAARPGFRGFAIKTGSAGHTRAWLKGIKYFKALVAEPRKGAEYSTRQHPIQSFLWSDYAAEPDTEYDITVVALYGDIGQLEARYSANFRITTEKEQDRGHGVWFNRGAIASHALSEQFQNKRLTDAMANEIDAQGQIANREAKWLSRGLAEACIDFINGTTKGEGLRVCAYEFTYQPILGALKRALKRGVDVRILYHYTKTAKDPNAKAIATAKLPKTAMRDGKRIPILFQRTRTKIPHNKFIVKLVDDRPREIWTGSTNFTSTGFLGQTNVGHLVAHAGTAATYLQFWEELRTDPTHSVAVTNAVKLTPNPPNAIAQKSTAMFYSPRIAENMLDWYAHRIGNSASLAMMTIPFNVATQILGGLGQTSDSLRLVILENPPTKEVTDAEKRNRGKLAFSNGEILGKQFIRYARGGGKVVPIAHSNLEKWFVDEELARPVNNGHVFFVHSKILLIDPLSDDPLVCSGSANFSKASLITNDENMLLIRGNTRVADIYLTEFDRIFRHFYARDAINKFAQRGSKINPLELDETDKWIGSNFKANAYKNNRRLLFFPDPTLHRKSWSENAAADPDLFANELELAKQARKKPAKKKAPVVKTAPRTASTREARQASKRRAVAP